MKKVFLSVVALATLISTTFAQPKQKEKDSETFDITGSVQFQAQKALWDVPKKANLEEFWGRVNFGMRYKSPLFNSELNIRAFPEGFGWEPLTTVNLDTNDMKISSKTTSIPKFQIDAAWVKYITEYVDIRVGRFVTTTAKTVSAGNYIDQNEEILFLLRAYYHNATEFIFKTEPLTSSILFGAGDRFLNTGYLRIYETVTPMEGLNISGGYRANVFDFIYNEDAELYNRFVVVGDYTVMPGFKPYFEVGFLQKSKNNSLTEKAFQYPFMIGTTIPTNEVFNLLAIEAEYQDERKVDGAQKRAVFNIQVEKNVGKYTKFQFSLLSDMSGAADENLRLALRMSAGLK